MKFKIIGNKKINGKEPGEVIEIKDDLLSESLLSGCHIQKVIWGKKKGTK